jgi:3-dehydroquinate dehydratase-2
MLGVREPEIYGTKTYDDLCQFIRAHAEKKDVLVDLYQSNNEGDIVTEIQRAYKIYDGIVINPAAYTHTSIAILDALKAVGIPTIEVHISDIHSRDLFRQTSITSNAAQQMIAGEGFNGYTHAIDLLIEKFGA